MRRHRLLQGLANLWGREKGACNYKVKDFTRGPKLHRFPLENYQKAGAVFVQKLQSF